MFKKRKKEPSQAEVVRIREEQAPQAESGWEAFRNSPGGEAFLKGWGNASNSDEDSVDRLKRHREEDDDDNDFFND